MKMFKLKIIFLSLLVSISVCNAKVIFGIGGLYMSKANVYVRDMTNANITSITRDETLSYQGNGLHIMGGGLYEFEDVNGLSIRGYMSFDYLKGSQYLTSLTGIGINVDAGYDMLVASGFEIGLFAGAEAGVSNIKFLDANIPSTGFFTPYANAGLRLLFLHKHSFEFFVKYPIIRESTLLRTEMDKNPPNNIQHQYLREITFAPIFGLRYVLSL